LRDNVPSELQPVGPDIHTFEGHSGGAGMDIALQATREDGRQIRWGVEIWIDRFDGRWYATVKGEIDVDDAAGDDRCVVDEQQQVASATEAVATITAMARIVAAHPLEDLVRFRWEDVDEANPST
jgi:hypothetical protein